MSSIVLNPCQIVADIWRHRCLLGQLIKRDVLLRYRGAMFGVAWIFRRPLIMLAVFAFIFGQLFQARWLQQNETLPFWLLLYCGLIAFNVFAETVSRAPTSVRGHPSFVKKIVFKAHILPLGAVLVHCGFNFLILAAALAWLGELHFEVPLLLVLLTPIVLMAVGLLWFPSAWGVFVKDMSQIVPIFCADAALSLPRFLSGKYRATSITAVPLRQQSPWHCCRSNARYRDRQLDRLGLVGLRQGARLLLALIGKAFSA